ncbi:MAG: SpoIIE family protein phosphatase, partial [Myxococcales bacterium]|nr:SpoIIE family protein phosphatase [Myxococcales bacterium]
MSDDAEDRSTTSRIDRLLAGGDPAEVRQLDGPELERLLWKYRGLKRSFEREQAFWNSTNDNLKLAYERLEEKDRELAAAYSTIREDLEVAAHVQKALLPRALPAMERELELAVHHRQLAVVGGDYYDFFRLPGGGYAIGVFDISGHGVSSALVTSYLKAQFMSATEQFADPQHIVEWVNRSSLSFLREIRKYATVTFIVVEPGRLRYVCGGGYGFVLRGDEELPLSRPNQFLGLRDRSFKEQELPFVAGDLLCLYTDGLIEGQDADSRSYRASRLRQLVLDHRDCSPARIVGAIVADY